MQLRAGPIERLGRCRARQRHTAALPPAWRQLARPLGSRHPSLSGPLTVLAAAGSAEAKTQDSNDVYAGSDIKPLKEGEEKHVISVFVADEAGLINRVAGVFARRGANIESLAVGLTAEKALFTIVVTGTSNTVQNLCKQLAKLVKVRYVEDITKVARLEREMLLLKLRAPPGPARTEVLQLAQIFRARVVDVAEQTLTLCVSGDPGKCAAFQKVMAKFGIVEIARTGRICLKRGELFMDKAMAAGGMDITSRASAAGARSSKAAAGRSPSPGAMSTGDVYAAGISMDQEEGVWDVKDLLLDPTYTGDGQVVEAQGVFEAHTLSIEVQDVPGVLNQVTGVFSRRGYNVQSLAVGNSEREGNSRICMVVPGTREQIGKLIRQLEKLVYVEKVVDLTYVPFVNRELMLVKVRCVASQRGELRDLVNIFRADVLDVSQNTMTIEILGKSDKMKALSELLEPYGIMEVVRTGRVAVPRESGVDNKFLEQMAITRVW